MGTPAYLGTSDFGIQPNEEEATLASRQKNLVVTMPEGETIASRGGDTGASSKRRISIADFDILERLGNGSYSHVSLVRRKKDNRLFAMKVIDKAFIARERKQHHIFIEREALSKLHHPNIVKLHSTFQDSHKLYFILDYLSGGPFSDYIAVHRKLSYPSASFYAAEIVKILEFLHHNGVAHRDLKPSNLILNESGHLTIIDFGTAHFFNTESGSPFRNPTEGIAEETFAKTNNGRVACLGTALYVAPEQLERGETGPASDLWALGCILFQMITGELPFDGDDDYGIYTQILKGTLTFPSDINHDAKDLIEKLLNHNPEERLGAGKLGTANDFNKLKQHSFFQNIDFDNLDKAEAPSKQIYSPFRNQISTCEKEPSSPAEVTFSSNLHGAKSQDNLKQDSQKVVLSGTISKKCGWFFYHPRTIVLYKDGSLECEEPDAVNQKSKIILTAETKVKIDSKTHFTISNGSTSFQFKDIESVCFKWTSALLEVISHLKSTSESRCA